MRKCEKCKEIIEDFNCHECFGPKMLIAYSMIELKMMSLEDLKNHRSEAFAYYKLVVLIEESKENGVIE